MNKKGAIELSIGTIVIVVLAMSMLIMGLVLVRNIFTGATDVVSMTNDQIKDKVSQLFGEDKKLVLYPNSQLIEIKQNKVGGFGIGIKNLLSGSSANTKFSYEVVVNDADIRRKCNIGEAEAIKWIQTGRTGDLEIASGDTRATKVLFNVPIGSPLCTIRYAVNVKVNNQAYASADMDVTLTS